MIFLRFPDEATYHAALQPYKTEDGHVTIPDWDHIGLISVGGEYDEDGNVIAPPVVLPGYHANAITAPKGLEQYVIAKPRNPRRVYAGGK